MTVFARLARWPADIRDAGILHVAEKLATQMRSRSPTDQRHRVRADRRSGTDLGLGATLGATGTDDHELSRTDLNGRSPDEQRCERLRTTLEIVWGPCKQKVWGSIPQGGSRTQGP